MNTTSASSLSRPRAKASHALAALLAGLSLAALPAAFAQTNGTWTSTTGGDWFNTANWSGGAIASDGSTSANVTATFSASGTQPVNLNQNITLHTLAFSTGTYTVSSNNGSVLTLAGTTTPAITGTATISAAIDGTQGFTYASGSRTLTLSGNNTYTGVTTVTNGNLTIRSNTSLGAAGTGNGTVVSQSSGQYPQLHFANNVTTSEDITLNMNWYSTTAGATVGGNLIYNDSGDTTLNGTLTLNRSAGSNAAITHVMGVQTGAGTLTLNGNISGAATGGQASGAYVDQTRLQLRTTAATAILNINGVISDGTLTTGGLSVYTSDNSLGISRLTGANTYTGSTVHQKGTLLINNTAGSGTGTGSVTVASTAIFGGTGISAPTGANSIVFSTGSIVAPGDVNDSGSAIAAGESLGFDLSGTTGTVTFQSGASISINLNASIGTVAESLVFTGLLTNQADIAFNNNLINFSITGVMLADGLYTLVSFDAANAYSGQLVLGAGLEDYDASLIHGANGIQLSIGAIPEPSVASLAAGLAVLGLASVRRRRRA